MMNYSFNHTRVCAIAVTLLVLITTATLAGVSNQHYDANATAGGLQKVCDDFAIDDKDVLSASCNKVTAGLVSKVESSINLSADLDDECLGQFRSLTPLADRVKVEYNCDLHTEDLNDIARWDATAGQLKLKAA